MEKAGFDVRRDTIRVFEEEEQIIQRILTKKKSKVRKDAWKEALRVWDSSHSLEEENQYLKNKIEEMSQKLDDIYDKLNVLLK